MVETSTPAFVWIKGQAAHRKVFAVLNVHFCGR